MRSWVIDEARQFCCIVSQLKVSRTFSTTPPNERLKSFIKCENSLFFSPKVCPQKCESTKRGLCLRQRDGTRDWGERGEKAGERIDSGIYRCFISVYRQWENKWNCSGGEQILFQGAYETWLFTRNNRQQKLDSGHSHTFNVKFCTIQSALPAFRHFTQFKGAYHNDLYSIHPLIVGNVESEQRKRCI